MSTYGDAAVAKLRAIVAVIDQQLTQASPVRAAWDELTTVLALGPAPQTRECPTCHSIGMRAASRCGHCWTALAALPALPDKAPREDS